MRGHRRGQGQRSERTHSRPLCGSLVFAHTLFFTLVLPAFRFNLETILSSTSRKRPGHEEGNLVLVDIHGVIGRGALVLVITSSLLSFLLALCHRGNRMLEKRV